MENEREGGGGGGGGERRGKKGRGIVRCVLRHNNVQTPE